MTTKQCAVAAHRAEELATLRALLARRAARLDAAVKTTDDLSAKGDGLSAHCAESAAQEFNAKLLTTVWVYLMVLGAP